MGDACVDVVCAHTCSACELLMCDVYSAGGVGVVKSVSGDVADVKLPWAEAQVNTEAKEITKVSGMCHACAMLPRASCAVPSPC